MMFLKNHMMVVGQKSFFTVTSQASLKSYGFQMSCAENVIERDLWIEEGTTVGGFEAG